LLGIVFVRLIATFFVSIFQEDSVLHIVFGDCTIEDLKVSGIVLVFPFSGGNYN